MDKIIDTHQHLWDTDILEYPWLEGFDLLKKRYTAADYREAVTGLNVVNSVHVEGDPAETAAVNEVAWLTEIAEMDGMIGAIAAAAPLEKPNAESVLEAITAYERVVAVRRMAWHLPDPNFYATPALIAGVKLLTQFNLSFELCANSAQLPAAITLVKATPDVQHALNHCGGPDIKSGEFEPWATHIRELAAFENVQCKISGIVTTARADWTREELSPYIRHLVETFGYDRVMFGSDWPVCTLAASYQEWVAALSWAVAEDSDAERHKLFYENAANFYGITG